jgi:nitroimidazol reductase NimA-like FMN-containing flavoprotein (pyridoxamine 5'-phosphate oxidase superfamily)
VTEPEQPTAGGGLLTDRTRLRRQAVRGCHDRATVHAVLDAGLLAHVAFAVDGRPWAVPMAYGRIDELLYLHGAAANQSLRELAGGVEACVTVTVVDGLVLARSAFHHSMNYRCAMVFGQAVEVRDPAEKARGLAAVVDHALPGRSDEARPPTDAEIRATRVLRMAITEASAKVRTGGPLEGPEDVVLPVWAGVVPVALAAATPVAEADLHPDVPAPPSVERWWPAERRARDEVGGR